jgi:hypothetical protein
MSKYIRNFLMMTRFDKIKYLLWAIITLVTIPLCILNFSLVCIPLISLFIAKEIHTSIFYSVELCSGCSEEWNQNSVNWYPLHMSTYTACIIHIIAYLKEKINDKQTI